MTALKDMARIECTGLWQPEDGQPQQEVFVSLGDNSLILSDIEGSALSHWSLAAIGRKKLKGGGIHCKPSGEGSETVEIQDDAMIDAIETVIKAVAARRPKTGRLRIITFVVSVFTALFIGFFWLPQAVRTHALKIIPQEQRRLIGTAILEDITRFTGSPCQSSRSKEALAAFKGRVLPGVNRRILVLRNLPQPSLSLPGGIILLAEHLMTDHDTAEVVAGYTLAAYLQSEREDPLAGLLEKAGMFNTLQLLTTGRLPDSLLRAYGEKILSQGVGTITQQQTVDWFAKVKISTTPYAFAIDPSGQSTSFMIENDPFPGAVMSPLMSDTGWLTLQNMCDA